MRIVFQNDVLLMSGPETQAEAHFMNKIRSIAEATGSPTVEFAINTAGVNGQTTHVGMTPIIPEGYKYDEWLNIVEPVPTRCQHCGGPDH